jgi:hypothetical protein
LKNDELEKALEKTWKNKEKFYQDTNLSVLVICYTFLHRYFSLFLLPFLFVKGGKGPICHRSRPLQSHPSIVIVPRPQKTNYLNKKYQEYKLKCRDKELELFYKYLTE